MVLVVGNGTRGVGPADPPRVQRGDRAGGAPSASVVRCVRTREGGLTKDGRIRKHTNNNNTINAPPTDRGRRCRGSCCVQQLGVRAQLFLLWRQPTGGSGHLQDLQRQPQPHQRQPAPTRSEWRWLASRSERRGLAHRSESWAGLRNSEEESVSQSGTRLEPPGVGMEVGQWPGPQAS